MARGIAVSSGWDRSLLPFWQYPIAFVFVGCAALLYLAIIMTTAIIYLFMRVWCRLFHAHHIERHHTAGFLACRKCGWTL